jgi:integrase
LERGIQKAITEAKTEFGWMLAVRDLACFYLLWHCGLRISEVCSLRLNDIDLDARKLFIHNSKERKDRIAYMSDTARWLCNSILPSVLTRTPCICSPPSMELCIRAAYKDAWFIILANVVYQ